MHCHRYATQHDQFRCNRSGLLISLVILPLASRSNCAAFSHHPDFAPPGNNSCGSDGSNFCFASATVRPGARSGRTAIKASRIAWYFALSTRTKRPGEVKFSISIVSGFDMINRALHIVNFGSPEPHSDPCPNQPRNKETCFARCELPEVMWDAPFVN